MQGQLKTILAGWVMSTEIGEKSDFLKCLFLFFLFSSLLSLSVQPALADPQWTMVWNDEFNGAANSAPDPTHWTYDTGGGGWGNGELETYTNTTANAYLDGSGHLVIQALDSGGNYTSARMKTQGVFDQAYGMIEASIQLPSGGSGIWPAWWMLGQNIGSVGWPACGEIDMLEDGLPWSNTVIGEHVHGPVGGGDYNGGAGVGNNYSLPSGTVNSGFHTYGVQWSPNQIQFFIDGTIEQTLTPGSVPGGGTYVFNHPFFMLLNLAIGGPSGSPAGVSFPQQMLVDYVRVYKLTDNGTSPYGGTAATIPGTIQAENFDTYNDTNDPVEPGEGFAYNSLPTNNVSGQYRTGDAISEEACSDTGGGYDVDYTSPGQWLQYTINVTQSGTYNLDARVASSGQGGTFHFDLDGNAITGEMTCPNTGGWQNWQDVVVNVGNINSGQHVLLLVEDTMGARNLGVCNFNYVNLSLITPPTPTPTFTPVVSSTWRVNAGGPSYTDTNGNIWLADTNYTGGTANTIGGAISGTADATLYDSQRYGASFNYIFNVPAGSYQVTLKFAETYSGDFGVGDRLFNVSINGTQVLSNLDIFAKVGANAALDEIFNNIAPSGGAITIQFTGATSPDPIAVIEAIQIIPQPATATPTYTATNTRTNTPTNTFTNTPTNTPTSTATNTPTNTVTNISTGTAQPTNTFTNTATETATNTPTKTPTNTSTATPTNTATNTNTNTGTAQPTNTATNTPTNTSTSTVTNTPTHTATQTNTNTSTNTPTSTPTSTVTNTPTNTPTKTLTNTPTHTPTDTTTSTPTNTLSPTGTSTPTDTATNTPTATTTFTKTNTPTATSTFTSTSTSTHTNTPTITPTYTPTITENIVIAEPYPNPSSGSPMTFNVQVPGESTVTLDVFTLAFRKVFAETTHADGPVTLQWDLRDVSGALVSNGLYYVRIQVSGNESTTKTFKVLVLR